MRIAIYSRKSKVTGKGESVENQIQMCHEYIEKRIDCPKSELEIETFEDEGFSGKNMDRPEFKRMMTVAKRRGFDYIICYRLDRISRSVSDFSTLIEELNRCNISFICIKEQFDTSTPMGRAMMYIASVFAQLERETIAERIRDNLLLLARTGRWLGGITPLGFTSEKVSHSTEDGKVKTLFKLTPIPGEVETVKLIFDKYLEYRSLTKVETFLMNREIKTRQDKYFTLIAVREVLTNPVYCVADRKAYAYFKRIGADICFDKNDFNGKHGISVFNRTSNSPGRQNKNDMSEWIISIGKHKGIIDSIYWMKVQESIMLNKHRTPMKKVSNPISLLSGLLICEQCGSYMRPRVNSNKARNENDEQTYSYLCELKKRSNGKKCDCLNINGNDLDRKVAMEVLARCQEGNDIHEKILALKSAATDKRTVSIKNAKSLRNQIEEKNKQIDNLILMASKEFSRNQSEELLIRLDDEVEKLSDQINEIKSKLERQIKMEEESIELSEQMDVVISGLKNFRSAFFTSSVHDKREFLRLIVDKVVWDCSLVHIHFTCSGNVM